MLLIHVRIRVASGRVRMGGSTEVEDEDVEDRHED